MTSMKDEMQELMQRSYNHIVKQGGPSIDPMTKTCAYRGKEGAGCAAAPFIVNYDRKMEGLGWIEVVREFPKNIETTKHEDFISGLQSCHDDAYTCQYLDFMEQFYRNIVALAEAWKLEPPKEIRHA